MKTVALMVVAGCCVTANVNAETDAQTGLALGPGFELVRGNCIACHSAKLVTQNRMSRQGWQKTIEWMQKTQGLWPLGDNLTPILDYLETHYSPSESGRRANLPAHLLPPLNKTTLKE